MAGALHMKIYTHPVFYRHDTGEGHPESASRIDWALSGIARAGLASAVVHEPAVHADTSRIIEKTHAPRYEDEVAEACRTGMRFFHSLDNPISADSFAAARAAVGTTLTAAADMLASRERAFVVARPPGHHAERVEAMGFCFFNTIACAAEWLREQPGIERVFIFDFDVHHGNGTQHLFEARDDVFYASMHRYPFYPGTGAAKEIGTGRGRGYTLNIPLEEESGDAIYLDHVEETIVRAIELYQPHAILLSSGFDAHRRDPLGGMRVSEEAYGEITRRVVEAAERWCEGRVLSLLEGGYDASGLTASVAEHVAALCERHESTMAP
jgi:acetoin utilization deacetylase AcuC-like enzyme